MASIHSIVQEPTSRRRSRDEYEESASSASRPRQQYTAAEEQDLCKGISSCAMLAEISDRLTQLETGDY